MNATTPAPACEIALNYIRSTGPVTRDEIADELLKQCQAVHRGNLDAVTDCSIALLLRRCQIETCEGLPGEPVCYVTVCGPVVGAGEPDSNNIPRGWLIV